MYIAISYNIITLYTDSDSFPEIHRKSIASAFWNYQVEQELTECNTRHHTFSSDSSREEYMDEVDAKRRITPYAHSTCFEECKKRGNDNS